MSKIAYLAYAIFQAALIHLYNCTNSDPIIAKEAKEYVKICVETCLEPLSKDIPAGPPLIPFLQTLSKLISTDDETDALKVQEPTQAPPPPQYPQQQQQSYFPMQDAPYQGFLSNLTEDNSAQSWLLNGNTGNSIPQAAWQQLFSTAGTPFAENGPSSRRMDAQGKHCLESVTMY